MKVSARNSKGKRVEIEECSIYIQGMSSPPSPLIHKSKNKKAFCCRQNFSSQILNKNLTEIIIHIKMEIINQNMTEIIVHIKMELKIKRSLMAPMSNCG